MKTASSLDFELDRIESSFQEMDGAVVGVNDEFAIGSTRNFRERRSVSFTSFTTPSAVSLFIIMRLV